MKGEIFLKKVIILLIVFSMIFAMLIPIIVNAEPNDIILSSGRILESLGVIKGDEYGNLMLDNNLRRQDMIVLVSRLYREESKAKVALANTKFTDITSTYSYYQPYISWAVSKGLIEGMDDNTFGINQNVTVQQFSAVLLRVLGYEEESKLWDNIPELAERLGIMDDISSEPKSDLTRGEMAVMTFNALKMTLKGSSLTLSEKLNIRLN